MEFVRKSDIAEKLPLTSEQRRVFQPRNRTAKDATRATHSSCLAQPRLKPPPNNKSLSLCCLHRTPGSPRTRATGFRRLAAGSG